MVRKNVRNHQNWNRTIDINQSKPILGVRLFSNRSFCILALLDLLPDLGSQRYAEAYKPYSDTSTDRITTHKALLALTKFVYTKKVEKYQNIGADQFPIKVDILSVGAGTAELECMLVGDLPRHIKVGKLILIEPSKAQIEKIDRKYLEEKVDDLIVVNSTAEEYLEQTKSSPIEVDFICAIQMNYLAVSAGWFPRESRYPIRRDWLPDGWFSISKGNS